MIKVYGAAIDDADVGSKMSMIRRDLLIGASRITTIKKGAPIERL